MGGIWPGRIFSNGFNLGDTWSHSKIKENFSLLSFHKLPQWLSYSLLEGFEIAGYEVEGLDELTGLAEYRNGGLFIDLGVLVPKDPSVIKKPLKPNHELVLEW